MIRRTPLPLAILSLVFALLPAAGASALDLPAPDPAVGEAPPAGASFLALGCYSDPEGDVAPPQADLVQLCVNHAAGSPANISVVFEAATPLDPLSDGAWSNPGTAASVGFSITGDTTVDRYFTITRDEDELVGLVTDGDGVALEDCGERALTTGGRVVGVFLTACLTDPDDIRVVGTLTYQPTPDGASTVDRVPDASLTAPLPKGDESPVCANALLTTTAQLRIFRLACGGTLPGTEPISQGVATSQWVFDDSRTPTIDPYQARWVVLARDDDFADALAGSSLSFGQGPLLFTYSPASAPPGRDPGRLADITRAEILRSLPRGGTVYVLGGVNALSPGIDDQLQELGYTVRRLAADSRFGTAAMIAEEVSGIVDDFSSDTGFIDTNMVLIANGRNWPDAVVAGSVGAFWGMPILLVESSFIPPETRAALDQLRPDYIHNIGGTGVIATEVAIEIREYANARGYALGRPGADVTGAESPWRNFCDANVVDPDTNEVLEENPRYVCRWGEDNRMGTSSATTQLNRDMVGRFRDQPLIPPNPQQFAVLVFLGTTCETPQPEGVVCPRDAPEAPNFAYVLSAATVSGRLGGAVFIPTEQQTLHPRVLSGLCQTRGAEGFIESVEDLVVVGATDRISDEFVDSIRALIEGGCPPAT